MLRTHHVKKRTLLRIVSLCHVTRLRLWIFQEIIKRVQFFLGWKSFGKSYEGRDILGLLLKERL